MDTEARRTERALALEADLPTQVARLVSALRSGELHQERVRIAADSGHPAAVEVVGLKCVGSVPVQFPGEGDQSGAVFFKGHVYVRQGEKILKRQHPSPEDEGVPSGFVLFPADRHGWVEVAGLPVITCADTPDRACPVCRNATTMTAYIHVVRRAYALFDGYGGVPSRAFAIRTMLAAAREVLKQPRAKIACEECAWVAPPFQEVNVCPECQGTKVREDGRIDHAYRLAVECMDHPNPLPISHRPAMRTARDFLSRDGQTFLQWRALLCLAGWHRYGDSLFGGYDTSSVLTACLYSWTDASSATVVRGTHLDVLAAVRSFVGSFVLQPVLGVCGTANSRG